MEPYFFHLIHKGNLENVKDFIYFFKTININCAYEDQFGNKTTPLVLASAEGHFEIVKYLMNFSAKNTTEAMLKACLHGNFEIAKYFFNDFPYSKPADINAKDKYGNTALDIAKEFKNKDMIDFLESRIK